MYSLMTANDFDNVNESTILFIVRLHSSSSSVPLLCLHISVNCLMMSFSVSCDYRPSQSGSSRV